MERKAPYMMFGILLILLSVCFNLPIAWISGFPYVHPLLYGLILAGTAMFTAVLPEVGIEWGNLEWFHSIWGYLVISFIYGGLSIAFSHLAHVPLNPRLTLVYLCFGFNLGFPFLGNLLLDSMTRSGVTWVYPFPRTNISGPFFDDGFIQPVITGLSFLSMIVFLMCVGSLIPVTSVLNKNKYVIVGILFGSIIFWTMLLIIRLYYPGVILLVIIMIWLIYEAGWAFFPSPYSAIYGRYGVLFLLGVLIISAIVYIVMEFFIEFR